MNQFDEVILEIEKLDTEFQSNGIPDRYREKWNVSVNVGMWIVGRQTAEWLYSQVLERQPQLILELGASVGYSALWMGKAAQTYGGKVITLEREGFKLDEAKAYIERVELRDTVTCVQADILPYLENEWKEEVDFLFIDAGKREYLDYLKKLEPSLVKGALVVADNVSDFAKQIALYKEYVENQPRYKTELILMEDGLLVSEVLS